jgi:hypothetical protein
VTLRLDTTLRNNMLDAITSFAGNTGYIRIYSGTQPASGGGGLSGNTLLAELRFNATFAPAAAAGVLTLNAITSDASADATGTATWMRLLKSDGTTFWADGTVSTSGADLNLNTVSITAGGTVAISSWTITAGNGLTA